MFKEVTAALCLTLCGGLAVKAGTQELSGAIAATMRWNETHLARDNRLETAKAMLTYWKDFDARLPRLSPTEQEWIESELNSASPERIQRASGRAEFGLRWLDSHVNQCLRVLNSVIEEADANPELEMYFWVQLINCYDDVDEIQRMLKLAGLSDGRHDGAFFTAANGVYHDAIVNRFVLSAMADTMGWQISRE